MILISGYYGYGNLGDEAILAALVEQLVDLGVERSRIVVLSGNPEQTEKHHNIIAIHRYDGWRYINYLRKAKLVISGGGSLFQDVTSKRTIPYYLGIIELAFLFRVPVVIFGQGIGPVNSMVFHNWIKRVARRARGIVVRDQVSAQFFDDLERDIYIGCDLVFGWSKAYQPVKNKSNRMLINLRSYPEFYSFKTEWRNLVKNLIQHSGYRVEFIALGPGDIEIGKSLAISDLVIRNPGTAEEAINEFVQTDICISMRLHGLIFAALAQCGIIGIDYDPKINALGEQLEGKIVNAQVNELVHKEIHEEIERFKRDHEKIRHQLQQQVSLLRERYEINRFCLQQLLEEYYG
ncbi:MAG: polysaccharide pyruvyl transferase CsaB [Firmicutes bacterium]|nr:polysaccharide pyruvyl transferase CsaB [Bacillota bacterium]